MQAQFVSKLILVLVIYHNTDHANCFKKIGEGIKHFGKEVVQHYETGVHLYEALGDHVIEEAYNFYCEHGGEGAGKFIQFIKCDKKHADEEYCKYASNGKMMFEMLCVTLKDKHAEWFGKAMGCFKANDLDCFTVWFEEMKSVADTIKSGAEMAGAGRR